MNFRQFFARGLAIVLPTVLTIWILLAAYQFVQTRIAQPINAGVRELVLHASPYPRVLEQDLTGHEEDVLADPDKRRVYRELPTEALQRDWLRYDTRRAVLERTWGRYSFPLDLIGLVLAIILIYAAGVLLGSYIGRRLYSRGESLLHRVPLIRRVYPSVKQVTDFLVGDQKEAMKFNRVVAVQYPRKGLWSVGLVTGQTMRDIELQAGHPCLTVFVPSSPTPFTGYVITVPEADTIDLPVTIEDALKFAISGGVLIPPNQKIDQRPAAPNRAAAPTPLPSGETP